MMILLVILVLGGYALYSMSPDERTQLKERVVTAAERAREEAARRRAEPEPFRDALRERTPWPLVMPVLVAVNVLVFLGMGWGSSDHDALVSWGASFGPRTTNAEWWRLLASMFVHGGFFQLLINCAALVQLGLILERLVGHVTFAAVYFAAGILASLVSLSDYPMATSYGASGAIFGLYGLLVASFAWTAVTRPRPAASVEPELAPATNGMFGLRDLPRAEPEAPASLASNEASDESDAVANTGIAITLTAAKQLVPCRRALPSLQPVRHHSRGRRRGGWIRGWIHLRCRADIGYQRADATSSARRCDDGCHRVCGHHVGGAVTRHGRCPAGNRSRPRSRATYRRDLPGCRHPVQARNCVTRRAGAGHRAQSHAGTAGHADTA